MSLEGHPHDGHTLGKHRSQVRSLPGEGTMREVFVDRGSREYKYECMETAYADRGGRGSITKPFWRFIKRRAAIELTIRLMKREHRLE